MPNETKPPVRTRRGGVLARRLFLLLVLTMLGPALANARTFHTVLQDDDLSLFSPHGLPQYINELRWLGVDELRISAEWKLEAPDPDSSRAPRGFAPAAPDSYTGPGMRLLDTAVRAAAAAGIHVIVDPAFSAPRWATSDAGGPSSPRERWYNTNIDVGQAAAWEQMLARRYSGSFTPLGESTRLPRVDTFTLWNEPNELEFLKPQWLGAVPVSADWYRRLVDLAYPAIKAVSPAATVLVGNTSNSGVDLPSGAAGVAPLAFIRRLACVDAKLQPVRDGPCAHFHTVPADGYAHHPYERNAPPWVPSGAQQPDWAQMGDVMQLQALLDALVARHRLAPGAENLWLTEQGYGSNAELTGERWTESEQAQLNAASEYLAWRDGQAASFSQFLLRDTLTQETLALRARSGNPRALEPGTWTTGLLRENFVPKPALWMFRSPILARAIAAPAPLSASGLSLTVSAGTSRLLDVWGRARPMRQPALVELQIGDGSGGFQDATATTTDANGIFDVSVGMPSTAQIEVRFRWMGTDGIWQTSPAVQPVTVAPG
jgi:hypothetical protein